MFYENASRTVSSNNLLLREVKKSKQPDYRMNVSTHLG